jgi:magnesium chelatase subunit H
MAEASHGSRPERAAIEALVAGEGVERALQLSGMPATDATRALMEELDAAGTKLAEDTEVGAILQALDGRFIRPAPGGDILRTPAVLPTGRNLHGFDPFRIPSAFAVRDGAKQAQRLIERHMADGNALPESIAMVLWGSDNLKSEGSPIGQALALMGALPRFDSYGRIAGATLVPLADLGRPRIDVVITLSGIFRDLMPLQIKLLAEAAFLAASAASCSAATRSASAKLGKSGWAILLMRSSTLASYGFLPPHLGPNDRRHHKAPARPATAPDRHDTCVIDRAMRRVTRLPQVPNPCMPCRRRV